MRNLKRALSLVMAMALIVGMMVISASAASKDFTDAGEIDHTEAVNTMVALGVIDGKDDGSYFDPDGTLTRAEMAKVVAFVMNGGVEPNIGTKVIPTYSDIDNHLISTITGLRRTLSTAPAWASSPATALVSSTPAAP